MTSEQPKGRIPNPYVISFIACDDTIFDSSTNKRSIIGILQDVHALGYPALHPRLSIFAELTNGHGMVEIEIRMVHAATDKPVFSAKGTVDMSDPRAVGNLIFSMYNVVIPMEGEYRFQLYSAGTLLVERRLVAHLGKVEPKGPDHE